MDEATRTAWEAGAYARCLREATEARARQADAAARRWREGLNAAEIWFDPDGDGARPTERAAIRQVFWAARGATLRWRVWLDMRDWVSYEAEIVALQDTITAYQAQSARPKAG